MERHWTVRWNIQFHRIRLQLGRYLEKPRLFVCSTHWLPLFTIPDSRFPISDFRFPKLLRKALPVNHGGKLSASHLNVGAGHHASCVTRSTSSAEVMPARAFVSPSSYIVRMPSARACCSISVEMACCMTRRRISSDSTSSS